MQITEGKYYRTRDGRKVEIIVDRGDCLMGHIVNGEKEKLWRKNGTHGASYISNIPNDDLIAEWNDTPTGPVRERVVKEIVEGVYGPLRIRLEGQPMGPPRPFVSIEKMCVWSAEDYRAAAATLLELAGALDG